MAPKGGITFDLNKTFNDFEDDPNEDFIRIPIPDRFVESDVQRAERLNDKVKNDSIAPILEPIFPLDFKPTVVIEEVTGRPNIIVGDLSKSAIRQYVSNIVGSRHSEIVDYLIDVCVANVEDISDFEDVSSAISFVFKQFGCSEEETIKHCRVIMFMLHGTEVRGSESTTQLNAYRLNMTVDMSTKAMVADGNALLWKKSIRDNKLIDLTKFQRKQVNEKIIPVENAAKKARDSIRAMATQRFSKRDAKGNPSVENATDIKIEGIDISYGTKHILHNAEFSLVFGRKYGLVGKTTLLKMISSKQLVIPSNISMLSVEQEVEGDDTRVIDAVLASDVKRQGLLDEEAFINELLNNPDDNVTEEDKVKLSERLNYVYSELEQIGSDQAPKEAASILFGLGFTPEEQLRPTSEYSGGWRMRIALARALFVKPQLLLLDEPSNHLDFRAILWLESKLQNWTGTIFTVSHDRNFLNSVCTDIIHMHSKRLDSYRGDFDTYLKTMNDKLKQQKTDYDAQQLLRKHIQEFIDKFRYNAKRAAMVQSRIKMLERLPVLENVEIEAEVTFKFNECEPLGQQVLMLDEVCFKYNEKDPLLFHNICCGSHSDSRICIVGVNGAGKSTLLKVLMGELEPTSGLRTINRKVKIGYFSQHHVDQLEMDMSSIALLQQRFPNTPVEEHRAALGRFGIGADTIFQREVIFSLPLSNFIFILGM
uniref:ABC transporter domain-containing protein n=1 Tax=Rhabditophanes sp. KR3021 TaxID=114890 RepID=A0AC35U1R8_9BILA